MTERVAITLATGAQFGAWTEVEIIRSLDGYTAVSLSGPFDHDRIEVRRAFEPLAFPRVTVTVEGELILTGRVKDTAPDGTPEQSSIGVTAYSLANDLAALCPTPDLYPLEFNGLDLRQIADKLVTPTIGEIPVFDGPPGPVFGRVRCETDREIHAFLADLALQRGFVLADAPSGAPLFRSAARAGAPVARLRGQPVTHVSAQFEADNWFSSITGRASRKRGRAAARYTERNPLYRSEHLRHTASRLGDTEIADVPAAVHSEIGRMIAAVVRYTVEDLPTWRDPRGELWTPNTTVTLVAPEAMIYRETELLVRSVRLRQTPEAETATLELVLPGSFGGPLPTELPWDF